MKRQNSIGLISMFYARPFGREHFGCFQRIKRAGLDFIELLVPEPGEVDLSETRAALVDNGLSVVLAARVNAARDLSSSSPAAHDAGCRYLETCIETAHALGASIVGGPLYGAPLVFAGRPPTAVEENERQRRVAAIVRGLGAAGKIAAQEGVTLAIEPLNRFETDVCNTAQQAMTLVEAADSAGVGIMLDTFHMNMEEANLAASIRRGARKLVHFQANESHRGFVGSGHVDWPSVARALADVNYAGPITLEPFRRNDERVGVPLAQWRAPERDEDADLAASVAFLDAALTFARSAP